MIFKKDDGVIVDHQPIILEGVFTTFDKMNKNGNRFGYLEKMNECLENLTNLRKKQARNDAIDTLLDD